MPPSSSAQPPAFLVHLRERTFPNSPSQTILKLTQAYQSRICVDYWRVHHHPLAPPTPSEEANQREQGHIIIIIHQDNRRAISNQPNTIGFETMLPTVKFIAKVTGTHWMEALLDLMETLQLRSNPRSVTTICYLWTLSNRVGDASRPQLLNFAGKTNLAITINKIPDLHRSPSQSLGDLVNDNVEQSVH